MTRSEISLRASELGLDLRDTWVMGSRVLNQAPDGRLFQWCSTRWVELGPRKRHARERAIYRKTIRRGA